jgi:uncharacterized integral membrane protein
VCSSVQIAALKYCIIIIMIIIVIVVVVIAHNNKAKLFALRYGIQLYNTAYYYCY